MSIKHDFIFGKGEMITRWYNILPDLPFELPPPLNPQTLEPVSPEDLLSIFPEEVVRQEVSPDEFIEIPGPVLDVYRLWRPTPLLRAKRLEERLSTPARIYFKFEGFSPVGSHKGNTAVAQAYFNRKEGTKRLTTETGAGQWGTALSMACAFFDLECTVYMVRISYEQKHYRRTLMEVYGSEVLPSPSTRTKTGSGILSADPQHPGSLGIAISEAVEDAFSHPSTKYSLGSVLNHVLLHQTVIGEETLLQLEKIGEKADVLIGCVGGGSNFGGLVLPFLRDFLRAKKSGGPQPFKPRIIAVEPTACPSLTRGIYAYDFGDTAGIVPALKMFTLGHGFVPPSIHAGGLRYHGMSPILSGLYKEGLIEARAVGQREVFQAAVLFAKMEGFLPAPESAHAVKAAIDVALEAKEKNEPLCIVFNLSGHGYLDLGAYEAHLKGLLQDYEPGVEIERSLKTLPQKPRVGDS
ncbi:MAG: TrpB-like pyridoxal phosphate-dependent enzyme [Caldiserica bacterium]|jgi:tryptophan synthase beta chain|nr:TrpB-like pyridoxal phosphate-dependent enzyme [Caldisericota bacterium]MDH7562427.1 TrpB-like pyridoxal phosphate-dependent enzyme [Caldisericota bacterium]